MSASSKYTIKLCPVCGNQLSTRQKSNKVVACSRQCGLVLRSQTRIRNSIGKRPAVFDPESNTYTVPLTRGYHAIIDACDVGITDRLWSAVVDQDGFVYAYRCDNKDGKAIRPTMHRQIMGVMLGKELSYAEKVDHVNGNTLDNRRENLRLATNGQNQANSKRRVDNKSGYKGVKYLSAQGRWDANIKVNGKRIHLGTFSTPELAHAAYCEAAIKYHGEFANDGTKPLMPDARQREAS